MRLYIFDADDTLRRTLVPGQPSPRAPEEWELLPGVAKRLRRIRWGEDAVLGIASNQDQVGYGHVDLSVAHRLLVDLAEAASGWRPPAEAVVLCPHRLDEPCECRKPEAGMLRRILSYYGIPADRALFVGDAETDRDAARRAGVPFLPARDFFGWSEDRR
ncbi:MAG TPA: HAD-IIIA family hydrolase [Gemmatimonadaceae bacterium]